MIIISHFLLSTKHKRKLTIAGHEYGTVTLPPTTLAPSTSSLTPLFATSGLCPHPAASILSYRLQECHN